ncbi:MAG: hypothetical protein Q9224_003832 [Gallowayella concinna]
MNPIRSWTSAVASVLLLQTRLKLSNFWKDVSKARIRSLPHEASKLLRFESAQGRQNVMPPSPQLQLLHPSPSSSP